MVIDNVFGLKSAAKHTEGAASNVFGRILAGIGRQCARLWCGIHGHLILLHFEPNKLSLQCALCGYQSEGWEVGRPLVARRQVDNRIEQHHSHAHPDRRRALRAVPSNARMAS